MAQFEIIETRRSGLSSSEFDVRESNGIVRPGEIFDGTLNDSPFDYVVLAVLPQRGGKIKTLVCLNWTLPGEFMNGLVLQSRQMTAPERKRYNKYIGTTQPVAQPGGA